MNFKKLCKNAIMLGLAGTMTFSIACGPTMKPTDDGKTKILVSLYAGGHGTAYFDQLIAAFMDKNPEYAEKYVIDYVAEKKHASLVEEELKENPGYKQMYIMAQNDIVSLAYQGLLEDVSDVVGAKYNGESVTLKDKMYSYNEWQSIYSVRGQGLYAMPYADSIGGWVYDHDMFVENNWYSFAGEADKSALTAQGISFTDEEGKLYFTSSTKSTNYEQGDRILTAGKDGKYGTYDDGQPITEAEFDAMVKKISLTAKPFISSGQIGSYAQYIISALVGMYGGVDQWNTYFTYDSKGVEYEMVDGTKEAITIENGYKVNGFASIYKAYEFIEKYFDSSETAKAKYTHPVTSDGSVNHQDTQSLFLLGYKDEQTNPMSAMLLEGAWWEYEARATFTALGKVDADRGYGKREYRYMLYPNLEGQVNDKTVFSAGESGVMIVAKDENKERLQVTKDFLGYMASDEAVKIFTKVTGCPMPYNVEFTDEDKKDLTPFARNMTELYYDSENIDIVRPNFAMLWSPLQYTSDRGSFDYFVPKINGVTQAQPYKTVRTYTLDQIKTGLPQFFNATDWASWIKQAQDEGFYQD